MNASRRSYDLLDAARAADVRATRRFTPGLLLLGLVLMALLVPVLLVLAAVAAPKALAAAVGFIALGAVTGSQTLEAQAGHWEPRDVSDDLTLMDIANDVPFDQLLRRLPNRRTRAKNIKVEYYRRERVLPRLDTISADSSAGSAGAPRTISVSNAALWKPNDVIEIVGSPTAKNLYVMSVDVSGGTLSVVALPSGVGTSEDPKTADTLGTVPALTEDAVLARLSTTKSTGDSPSEPRANQSVKGFNFCELIDAVVEADEDARRTQTYSAQPEYQIRRRETLETMRRDANLKAIFGKRSISKKDGKLVYTQDGLRAHVSEPVFTFSDGSLTESQLIDLGYTAGGNSGGKTRVVLGGSALMKNFDKVMLAKMQHAESRTVAGVQTLRVETRRTVLYVMLDPSFDSMDLAHEGVCFDPDTIKKAEFRPMENNPLKYKAAGVADVEGEWFMERACVEVHNPETLIWLRAT